jgi:hypothetical protein
VLGIKELMKSYLKTYIRKHGRIDLLPKRKEPLTLPMIEGVLKLRNGTKISSVRVNWKEYFWVVVRALITLLASTGQRKSEALHPDGIQWDRTFACRAQIMWNMNGKWVADPSTAQLNSLKRGDFMIWIPGSSKADWSGLKWAPQPVPMKWDADAVINAPAAMARMELMFPCHGADRDVTPLFTTQQGKEFPMRFSNVEKLLRPMLVATGLVSKARSKEYSWHSFRIWLASALHAMGVEDWQIQHHLRWATPRMLQVYARKCQVVQADMLEQVLLAAPDVSTVQTSNLPVTDDYGVGINLQPLIAALESIRV